MRRLGLILWGALVCAQTLGTQAQVASFHSAIDDSDQPYALYVPRDYSPFRSWPLVIALHGPGSNPRQNLLRVFGQAGRQLDSALIPARSFSGLAEVEFLVASPLARGDM